MNLRLYIWQRLTAALMAPLVLVHVAVIFYASRKGLSAADILGRTRGSIVWASSTALRCRGGDSRFDRRAQRVDRMVTGRRAPAAIFSIAFGLLLIVLGLRAVAAVVLP